MRLGIVCCVLFLASSAFAQTVLEAGRGIVRNVNVGTSPYGLDVDPATGTVYFIGDNGRDLYRLQTDGTVTQIANDVGVFVGQLSDLVLGADGLLYAMTTMGPESGTIQRFQTDGTELAPLATIATTPMSNAAGLDFDCRGDLYASDQEVAIFRVTPSGSVSSYSVGWQDVDEITRGYDDILYVQDGTARPFGHDKVFRVGPGGTIRIFASGLPGEIESGAFDFATGDYFAGDYDLGAIYRLHDSDADGDADVVTTVATGFGANDLVDIDYGRSSMDPGGYSLYLSLGSANRIVEIAGFPAPPSPLDCGPHIDDDGDGWCEAGEDRNGDGDCHDALEVVPGGPVDCDDRSASVSPSVVESTRLLCADLSDSDCDGDVDLDDSDCDDFVDDDGDGFCEAGVDGNADGDCLDALEDGGPIDCDDMRSAVSPAAVESGLARCTNGLDDDCNGAIDRVDPGCAPFDDFDGDGFCETGRDLDGDGDCETAAERMGPVDCNDAAAVAFPGNTERCGDGVDNDCDGDVDLSDLDCVDRRDDDGDGWCEIGIDLDADMDCVDPGELTADSDCDDTTPFVNPGATEDCGDGIDNDCNGAIDAEEIACALLTDADGDGYCETGTDGNGDGDCVDAGESTLEVDCNDAAPTIFPGAPENTAELCRDIIDNDCDAVTDLLDADCRPYVDGDADGWCPAGEDIGGDGNCVGLGETGAGPFDCDDAMMSVSPDATELCTNAIDDDCNGLVDELDAACDGFVDMDGDGWCPLGRDANDDGDCADAEEPEGMGPFDCNDDDDAIAPLLDEVCDDGLDNDCNGRFDAEDGACDDAGVDGDGDGWCPGGRDDDGDGDCLDPGEATTPGDCNDDDPTVSPDAAELCDDAVDNDCDVLVDVADPDCGGTTVDMDGDGICAMAGRDRNRDGDCDDAEESTGEIDCNDADPDVFPGAEDVCGDAVDQDCDGVDATCDELDGGFTGGSCSGCTVPSQRSEGSPWLVLLAVLVWIRRRARS